MRDTLRCPGCDAELTLPASSADQSVQCPRCRRAFRIGKRSSTAVTTAKPVRIGSVSTTEDHELFEEPRRLIPLHAPVGGWFALVTRLTLAASVAAFAMPTAYIVYDRMLQWLAPGFHFRPGDGGMNPRHEEIRLVDHAFFWIQITTWPAFLAFAIWLCLASRNAWLLATGLVISPARASAVFVLHVLDGIAFYVIFAVLMREGNPYWVFGLFLAPAINVAVAYFSLQEIWRASDPHQIERLDSWRQIPANWWIRLWALFCLCGPFFFVVAIIDELWGAHRLAGTCFFLAPLAMATAGILLIKITRGITMRQRQRYERLYEEPG